ncbi:major facilitator superfamily domain-containing protein [Ilyonectria sp. MPI-CAGE-AT-0026]|nr:major facilitator superfamily domain-containing protein [Ilyonectria sp. MPI-CAGE-AT-0026]
MSPSDRAPVDAGPISRDPTPITYDERILDPKLTCPSDINYDDAEKGRIQCSDSIQPQSSSTSHPYQPSHSEKPGSSQSEDQAPAITLDENIVWWDGDDDPQNPQNWTKLRKYSNCLLISLLTFIEPLASSIFTPGVPTLMRDFESSNTELAAFVVSVYVLGFAFGPMVLAPLSEMYGRLPVYHGCNVLFLAFTAACAVAPSLESLIAFRFLAGTFGAAPMTNGGGSIADMFKPEERAAVMAGLSIGPLLGPIIGPVIGGVLTDAKGWRWDFWVITIVSGAIVAGMFFIMRESYAPVILEKKARRLRKETGNTQLRSKLDDGLSSTDLLKRSIVRPMRLLLFSPICTIFAVYLAVVYGYLYLLFTSITYVFEDIYGFNTKTVGLVYLGLGVGCMAGMALFAWDSSREIKKMASTDEMKPELRLKLLPAAAVVFPLGFFIYGWTTDYKTHWMGPIVGLVLIGISNLICFMTISVYLVDAYERYAASALAANTIFRSIAGALLPLCGLRMYDVLGLGWGNTMLGLIAVALIPIPFIIKRFGEKLRKKYEITDL